MSGFRAWLHHLALSFHEPLCWVKWGPILSTSQDFVRVRELEDTGEAGLNQCICEACFSKAVRSLTAVAAQPRHLLIDFKKLIQPVFIEYVLCVLFRVLWRIRRSMSTDLDPRASRMYN